ncbi:MAG: zinc ribbon domain-containing protein YjdM [Candidatus Kapaibacterium sp.]|nr:alkylphosphonate utilization protein [Ignavibacteriota bacterium]
MTDNMPCPECGYEYTYELNALWNCSNCGNEWNPEIAEETSSDGGLVVKDANGTLLADGDTVVVIKDLPVKGASKPIKGGTKVKNVRLRDGDHNLDCKIDGFGAMALKSEFVKKA